MDDLIYVGIKRRYPINYFVSLLLRTAVTELVNDHNCRGILKSLLGLLNPSLRQGRNLILVITWNLYFWPMPSVLVWVPWN